MIVAIWIIFAAVGAALLIVPRRTCAEFARVAHALNEQSPQASQILIRLLGLALFIHFGLALLTNVGLID